MFGCIMFLINPHLILVYTKPDPSDSRINPSLYFVFDKTYTSTVLFRSSVHECIEFR